VKAEEIAQKVFTECQRTMTPSGGILDFEFNRNLNEGIESARLPKHKRLPMRMAVARLVQDMAKAERRKRA
jgi:hypothetical protein